LFKLHCIDGVEDSQLLTVPANPHTSRDSQGISKFLEKSKEVSGALDDASAQLKNLEVYGKPTPPTMYEFLKNVSDMISKLNDETTELKNVSYAMRKYARDMEYYDTSYDECINEISSLNFDIKIRKMHLYWLSNKLMSISGDCITFIQDNKGKLVDNIYYTPDMSPDVYKNLAELEKEKQTNCEDYGSVYGLLNPEPERCPCDESEWITMSEGSVCKGINCAARNAYYNNNPTIEVKKSTLKLNCKETENNKEYVNKFTNILDIQKLIMPDSNTYFNCYEMQNRIEYVVEDYNYHYLHHCRCVQKKGNPVLKKNKKTLFSIIKSIA
jgi:hypothetical protein